MPKNRKSDKRTNVSKEVTWKVETLRWTTFLMDNAEPAGIQEWWSKVAGVPKSDQLQRQSFIYEEIGTIGKNYLTLQWQPGRVDWLFNIKIVEQATMENLNAQVVTLDRFDTVDVAQENFKEIIARWFKLVNVPAKRLAMGHVLLSPAPSKEAAYNALVPFLKKSVNVVPEMSDLLFQVNRPRNSKLVKGIEINRLSKWMVAQVNPYLIKINPEQFTRQIGNDAIAIRLELDLSTILKPTGAALKRPNQIALFGEFSQLSDELCRNGDLP